jgi:septal ring factor EnvC (AmiA/AmiB activator)
MAHLYLKNNLFLLLVFFISFFVITSLNANTFMKNEIFRVKEAIKENKIELENLNQYKENFIIKRDFNYNKLALYKENITESIIAIYKLQFVPLSTLLINTNGYQDMAISYALFNYYTNYMNNQLNMIYEHLSAISENTKELEALEKKLLNINNQLAYNLKLLQNLNSNGDISSIVKQNKQFIKLSKDLSALTLQIANEYTLPSDKILDKKFQKNMGKFSYPVDGFLYTSYHQGNIQDIYYNGITILAQPKSLLYAPFDGEVVFVDNFPNYDNLIIIKHSASYFSIISGKFDALVSNAQLVKKKDVIGITSPQLLPIYFELQYKNKGVNVMKWVEENKKK